MKIPIKIESLENDIIECSKHLDFMKKSMNLGRDLNKFIKDYNFDENRSMDLEISNVHCVATTSQLEISIILKSLFYSDNNLEQKHILKNGILIIYESIKTIAKFNKLLKDYSELNSNLLNDFNNYITELKNFKKNIDFDKNFKDIRNNIAGHINYEFVEYAKLMDSIEIDKTVNILIIYRFITNQLNDYLFKCMTSNKI